VQNLVIEPFQAVRDLAGAANDFEALERLRKLAFAETVPPPKIPEQLPLELPAAAEDEDESAD
jgi:hypothetical protein